MFIRFTTSGTTSVQCCREQLQHLKLLKFDWHAQCDYTHDSRFPEPRGRLENQANIMKMLFYSSDWTEVELVRKEFLDAKIPCEVRVYGETKGIPASAIDAQLWIKNDHDCYRALMLCVQHGIGFGKPAPDTQKMAA